jgi:UbiD family decarboxylase
VTDVNLLKLPVPHWSNYDGGRYIGTWHINVTKDPVAGSRNVGVYRMQLLGTKHATVSASPRSHLYQHVVKSEKEGRPFAHGGRHWCQRSTGHGRGRSRSIPPMEWTNTT